MEVDIYGDLDNLDNQFEVIQQENEQLKETVQKLEETSIKFSIEINELKRINGNLEVNISSLYKTAKAEIERKNKQIAELRKELDNMLFKRGPKRKLPDKNDDNSQEKQFLNKQFEKAQHDIDQKNRIIQSLNSELVNVRKELEERNNVFKRYSSQIEQENEDNFQAKKIKLEKDTCIDNEEDYRNYRNRYEMRENGHYHQRSKSPNYRRYNSRGRNDLRSRIDLKRINYRRSRSRSREDFKPNNRRNNRQNYRGTQLKGRYKERSESPMYNTTNKFNNTAEDEKQNYFSEQDSGVFNSQTTESSYTHESIATEPRFSVSPVISHEDFKLELEDGELNNTSLVVEDRKLKNKDLKSCTLADENKKNLQGKNKHDRYTKINVPVATDSHIYINKIKNSAIETVTNNTLVASESKYRKLSIKSNMKKCSSDGSKSEQDSLEMLEKYKETLKNEIKQLANNTHNKDSEAVEMIKENICRIDLEKSSKTKIEKVKERIVDSSKCSSNVVTDSVPEFRNNEVVQDGTKTEIKKAVAKKYPELKPSKDKKERSKSDKIKIEKSVSEKDSNSKSVKENTKLSSEIESKSTKQEKEVVKSIDTIISETKPIDTKIEKTNSESKDISVVSRFNPVKNKNDITIAESIDTNIKIVSDIKSNKYKKEKKISESDDTNISIVSDLQPDKIKTEKKNNESTKSNISIVSVTKNLSKTAKANVTLVSEVKKVEDFVKKESDVLKQNLTTNTTERVDETYISESKPVADNILSTDTNLKQNESEFSNIIPTHSIPGTCSIPKSEENSKIESLNTETTTQQNSNRKPPLRGRRRRCIISIT